MTTPEPRGPAAVRVARGGHGRPRLALLCSDDPHHAYLLGELTRRFRVAGVVVETGRGQRAALWRRGRYLDWVYRHYHRARQRLTGRARYRDAFFGSRTRTPGPVEERVVQVDSVNSDEAVDALKHWRPDLTVCCGTMTLGRRVLRAAGTVVNVHGGVLPDYRGNHGVFFATRDAAWDKVGATLHLVNAGLDTGPVLQVVRPDVYPHDNDEHLYCRSVFFAMAVLFRLLDRFEAGEWLHATPQPPGVGRTYRHRDRTPLVELTHAARRLMGGVRPPFLPAPEVERG